MISVFDLFKIGIGPSSSHTIGPMRAAYAFRNSVVAAALSPRMARLRATLFGSLAWTGRGHATDKAVVLGLLGMRPESADPDDAAVAFQEVCERNSLRWADGRLVPFDLGRDVVFDLERLMPRHSNAMTLTALDERGQVLLEETWYSIGGGFVMREGDAPSQDVESASVPYYFAAQLSCCSIARRPGCPSRRSCSRTNAP